MRRRRTPRSTLLRSWSRPWSNPLDRSSYQRSNPEWIAEKLADPGSIAMVLWGWHSDVTCERIWHVALPLFLAAGAFAWSAAGGPLLTTMAALTFATVGIYAAIDTSWSLPTAILTGTGAAAGLALVNATGNLGGLAGPTIMGVMKEATGTFTSGLLFLAGALVLGALIALLFGYATRARGIGSPRASAQDLQKIVLQAAGEFCSGQWHDDATLIVLAVE